MPNVCPVCGDGASPPGDYFGVNDLTADHEDAAAAAALADRRDEVAARLSTAAGLGARIPNARWTHRTGYAAHLAAYTRTLARLQARRWRLLGWPWHAVSVEMAVFDEDRARARFASVGPFTGRDRCATCGARRRSGAVTDFVPHALLSPAMRRHAAGAVPDWVPPDDQPQSGLLAVTARAGRVGGAGGLRNLVYATDGLLGAAVARDCWDGATDAELSAALGAPVRTTSGAVDVPGVLDVD